jgi:hypothetical protein
MWKIRCVDTSALMRFKFQIQISDLHEDTTLCACTYGTADVRRVYFCEIFGFCSPLESKSKDDVITVTGLCPNTFSIWLIRKT